MGAQSLTILLLIIFIMKNMGTTMANSSSSTHPHETYLTKACNATTFPKICYKSLSSYASKIDSNPQKLCTYALSIVLKAARDASAAVSNLSKKKGMSRSEGLAFKDCVENIGDSIDELKEAVDAMSNLEGADVEFQLRNIKTWVSAALTDDDTCAEGFEEAVNVSVEVKNTISKSIVRIARLTSNALSLINSLGQLMLVQN